MKKFLALVIGIVMALSLVTIPAMADAGPGSATFTVTAPEKVERGEQFDVVLSISGTYQMNGLQLHFPFDEDNFEYVSVKKGAVLVDAQMEKDAQVMLTYEYNEKAGRKLLVLGVTAPYPDRPETMEGELFTLTLKAKTEAAAGDYEMTPTEVFATYMPTSVSQPVNVSVVSATVTIDEPAAEPTEPPTEPPTEEPTEVPTEEPTEVPTEEPTEVPTEEPTEVPSEEPTEIPSEEPTEVPSEEPVEAAATIKVGEYETTPGGVVEVALTIDGEYLASGLTLWLNYNSEMLTIESITEGAVMNAVTEAGGSNILDYETIAGSIRYGFFSPTEDIAATGEVFIVTIRVSEDAKPGDVFPLEIKEVDFVYLPIGEDVETPVDHTVVDGQIAIVDEDVPPIPPTGTVTMIGVGIAAIAAGAGIVIFRKKKD